jgi:hypothetical protein
VTESRPVDWFAVASHFSLDAAVEVQDEHLQMLQRLSGWYSLFAEPGWQSSPFSCDATIVVPCFHLSLLLDYFDSRFVVRPVVVLLLTQLLLLLHPAAKMVIVAVVADYPALFG